MADDIFLDLTNVKGESKDRFHKDEIDILSCGWGVTGAPRRELPQDDSRAQSNFHDLTLTKYPDRASPLLFMACANGTHFAEAKLTIRKAGGDKPLEYMVWTMSDVLVMGVRFHGGGGGDVRGTEEFSLNYAKIKCVYQPQKQDGSKDGGEIKFAWDLRTNQAI